MTVPLVWLLLSAIAVLAPPAATGPQVWDGAAPVVVTNPTQPPRAAWSPSALAASPPRPPVLLLADQQSVHPRQVGPGLWRGQLVAPSAGPVTLSVRFTVHGSRYQSAGGVIFVVPNPALGRLELPIGQPRRASVEESRDTAGQGCRVTPGRGNPLESATERRPPTGVHVNAEARVKRWCKRPPASPVTGAARQAPPGATPIGAMTRPAELQVGGTSRPATAGPDGWLLRQNPAYRSATGGPRIAGPSHFWGCAAAMSFRGPAGHPGDQHQSEVERVRKIVVYELMSLDGVAERPETFFAEWDDAMDANLAAVIETQDAVILGRRSYTEWARFWPSSDIEPFATFINGVSKYVATSTPLDGDWANATAVDGGLVEFVRDLRQQPGGDVGVHASISVAQALLAADVVDELRLVVAPTIVGRGRRLLDGLPSMQFQPIRSELSPTGSLMVDYRVTRESREVRQPF